MKLYNNQRIRWLLKREGIPIREAAEICECSVATINNILKGEDVKLSTLYRICDKLNMRIVDLFDINEANIELNNIAGHGNGINNNVTISNASRIEIDHLKEIINEKERLIESLQQTINILTTKN